ncbi:hypothetical protein AAI421_14535 [Rhodococcus aetherivorans]|uniref:hypothetical protein n=1 Tax=Rhodococcus aetherivorans TaxID=191292 RepID=UPI0031E1CFFB
MSETFYLPREQQTELVELLDQVPDTIEDLTIAVTRQDRIGGNNLRIRSGIGEQPLPLNLNASEASDVLHDTLASWVRHTCEHRALDYTGRGDTMNLARWLKRWIVALALSPGADESLGEIRHAIHNARRACDRPRDKSRVLLGYCVTCELHIWGHPDNATGTCRTCRGELSMDHVRQEIDSTMDSLMLPARDAAAIITTRYGKPIKPKSIYDMAYRSKNPIKPVEMPDGTSVFDVRAIVDDLKRRGRIA